MPEKRPGRTDKEGLGGEFVSVQCIYKNYSRQLNEIFVSICAMSNDSGL